MKKKLRVLVTAGGSGGHIYPLTAVTDDLQHKAETLGETLDLRFFGDPGNHKEYLTEKGLRISKIMGSKMRRYSAAGNFLIIPKLAIGLMQSLIKMYFFMPDVVFSKSGPGTLPVVFAARWYRIPVIIHESDAVPGLTNRIAGKFARLIELSWEKARKYFPEKKEVRVTGNPIRKEILTTRSRAESRKALGLTDEKPIILLMGGSQGAEALNSFFLENSESLLRSFEWIHVTGEKNYEQYKKEYDFMAKNHEDELKARYALFPYLTAPQMADALNAADIVISRSGSAIFEIAAHKKPAILVPLPGSANNHQAENAYTYAEHGAGTVIEQENLLPSLLIEKIERMIKDQDAYQRMQEAAEAFVRKEAATIISQDIITIAHPEKSIPKLHG